MLKLITIKDALTELQVAPLVGGAIASWRRLSDGAPLFRPLPQETSSLIARQLAAFPLIPWSNRIAEGGVEIPEGWIDLPVNTDYSPFAMHGRVWQEAWQVVESRPDQMVLEVQCQFPVALRAKQTIRLQEGRLTLNFEVTHCDERPFWHGFGLHPYFPRNKETLLEIKTTQVWLNNDRDLPDRLVKLPEGWDFSAFKTLPEEKVDNVFTGWDGHCLIREPKLGYQLRMNAPDTPYFILYCPPKQSFFCAEPVSHPTNAHHMEGRPGLKLLKYSEQLHWQVSFKYEAL